MAPMLRTFEKAKRGSTVPCPYLTELEISSLSSAIALNASDAMIFSATFSTSSGSFVFTTSDAGSGLRSPRAFTASTCPLLSLMDSWYSAHASSFDLKDTLSTSPQPLISFLHASIGLVSSAVETSSEIKAWIVTWASMSFVRFVTMTPRNATHPTMNRMTAIERLAPIPVPILRERCCIADLTEYLIRVIYRVTPTCEILPFEACVNPPVP